MWFLFAVINQNEMKRKKTKKLKWNYNLKYLCLKGTINYTRKENLETSTNQYSDRLKLSFQSNSNKEQVREYVDIVHIP